VARKRKTKPKNTKEVRFNDIEVAKRVSEIAQLRLQGKSYSDVKKYMMTTYELTENRYNQYAQRAKDKVRQLLNDDLIHIRVIHADRYEWFYQTFLKMDCDRYAMDALGCIERLLGLHSNTIGVSIHNLIEKKQQPNLYDYTKLTEQELKRLKQLVDKCKK